MADQFIAKLDAISAPGTSAIQFLKKLGPIHSQWHQAHNNGTGSIGFLLFHWELVKRFKAVGGPVQFGDVVAFTSAQLTSYNAQYDVTEVVRQGDVASMEEFSGEIEAWHNNAHMAIGMFFHKNLMNPKTNVRLVQFWQLHYFINDRFEEKLGDFRSAPSSSMPSLVAQLESSGAVTLV
jgi:hypothetical protein